MPLFPHVAITTYSAATILGAASIIALLTRMCNARKNCVTPKLKLVGKQRGEKGDIGFIRPFRCLWALEELNVAYEQEECYPRKNQSHPLGKIPSLHVDGDIIFESVAINTYLSDRFRGRAGHADLVPRPGTLERGQYEQLVCMLLSELDASGLWIHRKHDEPYGSMMGGLNPDAVKEAKRNSFKVLDYVGSILSESNYEYLLGSFGFSAADILLVTCLDWAEGIGWYTEWATSAGTMAKNRVAMDNYFTRCRARPAYTQARELP